MRQHYLAVVLLLTIAPALGVHAQPLTLPAQPGQGLTLAPEDSRLELQQQKAWQFQAQPRQHQVVLNFRVRIDNPSTVGSCNMLKIQLNGQAVGLKTPRRQLRLLNKPNKFAWTDPPSLNWFIPPEQWRLAYAPDFDILTKLPYCNAESYHFALDVSDLVKPGENTLLFTHTGNKDIAAHAGSDLALIFRDLRLEVRKGPGVLPGEPPRPPRFRPFVCGQSRSREFQCQERQGELVLRDQAGRQYVVTSFIGEGPAGYDGPCRWQHRREVVAEPARGRLLITDHFRNTNAEAIPLRLRHELRLGRSRSERVNFGGREDPNLEELNRPECPYLFLPHDGVGVGMAAYDDVLRMHGVLNFDDARQAGGLRDDWFGLPPHGECTMTWAVYCTATDNVFDLVNLIRRDWGVSFPIPGGVNFFEPDAILAYDDAKLKEHLDRLNINVTMSQGGWYDRKLVAAGQKNVGHGPIVAGVYYADYRVRLKAACEKLRRLRPGIKCLVYYDCWLVSGAGIAEHFADSFYARADGKPRMYQEKSAFDFPLANVVPTLDNTMGQESLAQIPPMILDEIGADGLYWDEIANGFGGNADYAHPDPYTYLIDSKTGAIVRPCGAPDLAAQPFKLAFMKAFLDRGAMILGNGPPTTMTEQQIHFTRMTETDIPHHPGLASKTWLYTPISYAGWSTYHKPGVTEADFLADIKEKLWNANLYLFSAPMFYPLFTQENLATYEYPITVLGLDEGVIVGQERIITLRPGRFGWPGRKWTGELLLFDRSQTIMERRRVTPRPDRCVAVDFQPEQAAVIVADP
ncbi:MAG: hypothetical protein KKI08_01775 [Armatimonadetes bacterium]|nr:hypothetical protein [Armatimonadota bacterium]